MMNTTSTAMMVVEARTATAPDFSSVVFSYYIIIIMVPLFRRNSFKCKLLVSSNNLIVKQSRLLMSKLAMLFEVVVFFTI